MSGFGVTDLCLAINVKVTVIGSGTKGKDIRRLKYSRNETVGQGNSYTPLRRKKYQKPEAGPCSSVEGEFVPVHSRTGRCTDR